MHSHDSRPFGGSSNKAAITSVSHRDVRTASIIASLEESSLSVSHRPQNRPTRHNRTGFLVAVQGRCKANPSASARPRRVVGSSVHVLRGRHMRVRRKVDTPRGASIFRAITGPWHRHSAVMRIRRASNRAVRGSARRLVVFGCVGIYLLIATGLPLPAPIAVERPVGIALCGCPVDAARSGTCCCKRADASNCCRSRRQANGSRTTTSQHRVEFASIKAVLECNGLGAWSVGDVDAGLPLVPDELISGPQLVATCLVEEVHPLWTALAPPVPPPRTTSQSWLAFR